MQTLYYTTENFIRHTGNVVDLAEYRRRLERAVRTEAEEGPAALPQAPEQRAGLPLPGGRPQGEAGERLAGEHRLHIVPPEGAVRRPEEYGG